MSTFLHVSLHGMGGIMTEFVLMFLTNFGVTCNIHNFRLVLDPVRMLTAFPHYVGTFLGSYNGMWLYWWCLFVCLFVLQRDFMGVLRCTRLSFFFHFSNTRTYYNWTIYEYCGLFKMICFLLVFVSMKLNFWIPYKNYLNLLLKTDRRQCD